jgi:hypothetical protein
VRITSSQAEFESQSHWFTESSLSESLRFGECLICSNLIHSERHAIHSFLWEGMMSPHVRGAFLEGGGFCARHFWIAKRTEEDGWRSGGVGVAILCENLVDHAIRELPREAELTRRTMGPFQFKRTVNVPPPGAGCIFCHDWMVREEALLEILEYLRHKPAWFEKLERSPLCVHHALMALQIWREPDDKLQLRCALEEHLRQLLADLKEFIRKHDWNHRDEPLGREKDAVLRAIQVLTGLARQFPVPKTEVEGGGDNDTRKR